jgi:sugar phosphate isomerase/epimerase
MSMPVTVAGLHTQLPDHSAGCVAAGDAKKDGVADVKIGINMEFLRSADKSFAFGAREAAKIGYKYIEPLVNTGYDLLQEGGFYHAISMEEDPLETRQICDALGLTIESVSGHAILSKPEVAVHYQRRAIQWASDVGAKIVNTDDGPKADWMDDDFAFAMIKYTLTKVLKTAERYGVYLALEPHQASTQHVETFNRIMNLVPSDYLKINYDTGNAYLAGNDPVEYLKALSPERVVHVHAKDISIKQREMERGKVTGTPVGCACGEGVIDWPAVVQVLKHAGFNGVLSVECGTVDEARRSYEYLSGVLKEAGVQAAPA